MLCRRWNTHYRPVGRVVQLHPATAGVRAARGHGQRCVLHGWLVGRTERAPSDASTGGQRRRMTQSSVVRLRRNSLRWYVASAGQTERGRIYQGLDPDKDGEHQGGAQENGGGRRGAAARRPWWLQGHAAHACRELGSPTGGNRPRGGHHVASDGLHRVCRR